MEVKIRGYAAVEMVNSQWRFGTGIHRTVFAEHFAKQVGQSGETFIWTESGWLQIVEGSQGLFTGLKDKNGSEIYEGDIVRFVDFDSSGGNRADREFTGVIKYQSGLYEIWKNNDSEFFELDGAFILNHAWLQDDEFEVIGNIYENPELLEVE